MQVEIGQANAIAADIVAGKGGLSSSPQDAQEQAAKKSPTLSSWAERLAPATTQSRIYGAALMPATSPTTRDFLIPGEDYLARKPGFRLVGRDRELQKLTGILMRRSRHNILLIGAGGVGCSAICLGLQELKNSEDAPLDIVGKRIFWLDTDELFSSGDHAVINEGFRKLMRVLTRTSNRDTLLILEDARSSSMPRRSVAAPTSSTPS